MNEVTIQFSLLKNQFQFWSIYGIHLSSVRNHIWTLLIDDCMGGGTLSNILWVIATHGLGTFINQLYYHGMTCWLSKPISPYWIYCWWYSPYSTLRWINIAMETNSLNNHHVYCRKYGKFIIPPTSRSMVNHVSEWAMFIHFPSQWNKHRRDPEGD